MSQICGHIPQKLQTDVTCIAAQLSVSFFIETFIHAKEKVILLIDFVKIFSTLYKFDFLFSLADHGAVG